MADAPTQHRSNDAEVAALARELIADIELERITGQPLLLKARRLARMAGREKQADLFWCELYGYGALEEHDRKAFLELVGRTPDQAHISLGALIDSLDIVLAEIETARRGSGLTMGPASLTDLATEAQDLRRVIRNVTLAVHEFAMIVLAERVVGDEAASVFEDFSKQVDGFLQQGDPRKIEQIQSAIDRIDESDAEAPRHICTTLRNMLERLADSIPAVPTEDGKRETPTSRIKRRIDELVSSKTRGTHLRQTAQFLYDRTSAGIHHDVDLTEARTLIVKTYVFLGEMHILWNAAKSGDANAEEAPESNE